MKYKKVICKIDSRECVSDKEGYGTCGDLIEDCSFADKILPIRANKHLGVCTEICKMNPSGICAFSLRNSHGCYLDPEVQKETVEIYANALVINTVQRAKEFVRGKL